MDELNVYMPLIRAVIQNVCAIVATYGYMSGDLVMPITALSVAAITGIWTAVVQSKKNAEIKTLREEVNK